MNITYAGIFKKAVLSCFKDILWSLHERTKPTRNLIRIKTVTGRIILRWIFKKWDSRAWTVSMWHRIGTGDGHLWLR